jgi:hypothetical protein
VGQPKIFLIFTQSQDGALALNNSKCHIRVFNVDGTENQLGQVTKYCTLRITCGDMDQLQTFYVTNLGKDRVILGYPWLEAFNPQLDWKNGTIASPNFSIYLKTQWYQTIS